MEGQSAIQSSGDVARIAVADEDREACSTGRREEPAMDPPLEKHLVVLESEGRRSRGELPGREVNKPLFEEQTA